MNNNLTVIIPTLNNTKGLQYLLNYFKEKPYKVIVVDNSKKNLGFAGGVNKGAENIKTKWMLVLNDDIEFREEKYSLDSRLRGNDIENIIKYAEKNNLDAVSPILRNPDGRVENYGYKILPIGKIELVKEYHGLDPRLRGDDNASIDGITAACLLIKTEVFKRLGGFDESFFAYLEDVDFFLRMKKMDPRLRGDDNGNLGDDNGNLGDDKPSFGIAYDVEVLHNHMTTTKTMGNFKARQDMINWWRLYFKHPEKFRFNLGFIVERLRNISGYLKATFKSI